MQVIDDDSPGFWLIRGAAGSGKTTSALLRLKFLARYWRDRREDLGLPGPVRILVLTFNRTLRGYINELASSQIQAGPDVHIEVTTFGAWAQHALGRLLLERGPREAQLQRLSADAFPWPERFLADEVDYVLGRFPHDSLADYLDAKRDGRGITPRVDRSTRVVLLDQVVSPYQEWKRERGISDWADLAHILASSRVGEPYDVVIVDETQDFSANQVRAIVNHLAEEFVCSFIRDNTQRIYPNGFTWREVGIDIPTRQNRLLQINYRNTEEIAAFARPLVADLGGLADAALPDFESCTMSGPMPYVLRGRFSNQLDWALDYIQSAEVADDETIAFLHPRGGGWFSEVRRILDEAKLPWTSLTREAEWPEGDETIALSTMHSAKGLEFDHVLLLGYNAELLPHGDEEGDSLLATHRRVLAMAIGRARKSVVLGYKADELSSVLDVLDPATFQAIELGH
jgi:superfamily I DNA/RNA helicase